MIAKEQPLRGAAEPAPSPDVPLWSDPQRAEDSATAVVLDCGWGRLLFGQTFSSPSALVAALREEAEGRRDVALYVKDPHVVLATEPHALFLDPSHTFRLDLRRELDVQRHDLPVRMATAADEGAINRLYRSRGMVPLRTDFLTEKRGAKDVLVLVCEDRGSGEIVGVVMGIDHVETFGDPDKASSLWALAVDPASARPGVGLALVLALADQFRERGRRWMDLSVMHDNTQAIALYEKLGFRRVPVFCVKRRNTINQPLYVGPAGDEGLNIYAKIIVDEARRRGISVEVEDAKAGLFTLTLGARSLSFREALGDLTSAVAMSRCDDKALTRRLLVRGGLSMPEQATAANEDEAVAFLAKHKRIVVKPARGEQGHGVYVDLRDEEEVRSATRDLMDQGSTVIVEEFVEGQDLRIIVIDGEVVAAAIRKPAEIEGDGRLSVRRLIEKQSRRRAAATRGESQIPLDSETERCVVDAGYGMDDILPAGERLQVRKTANLHSGGTIHDVTSELHPVLAEAAVRAAEILEMPVVGFDFMVEAPDRAFYRIIEANERPGLANHEPAPTAERFIDFHFPETRSDRPEGKGG